MLNRKLVLIVTCLLAGFTVHARGVYQHPDAFLDSAFNKQVPKPAFIWFTGDVATTSKKILGHKPITLRTRYWKKDKRTAWILEEIGKEKLITAGFVINEQGVEKVKVLIFRESRGWEVKRKSFTDQFTEAKLDENLQLDKNFDGISGATLSVNALGKLTRLALYLHQQVIQQDAKNNKN